MTVAVTKGLAALAEQLRALGYNVVTYGEYTYPIDALIYLGEGLARFGVTSAAGAPGVLMINAKDKTISQIDGALKRRTYTPLF